MAERTCSIDGCGRRHSARGWCALHYNRWKSNGDPLVRRLPVHAFAPGQAPVNKGSGASFECEVCGRSFSRRPSRRNRFCSKACQGRGYLGAAHPRWTGYGDGRNLADYKAWRTAVFERDDYTCRACGARGGALNADHIRSWAAHPDDRLNVENGRTLCVPCHRLTETFGRPARMHA